MLRAATCMAVTSLARSLRRLGTTMPSAATTVGPRADRDRHRAGAQAHLLDGRGVVVAEHPGQLAAQRARLVDRVRRDPRQVTEHLGLDRGRGMGQEHLAHARGVHRQPRPDRAHHRDGGVPGEPVEVEHLRAVAHGEVHRGQRRAVEVVEVRRGELPQSRLHGREQADVPQPTPHDVLPRLRAAQRAPGDELADEPVRRRHRQVGTRSQPAQREAAVLVVERPQQRQRPAGDRGTCTRDVAGHGSILPLDGMLSTESTREPPMPVKAFVAGPGVVEHPGPPRPAAGEPPAHGPRAGAPPGARRHLGREGAQPRRPRLRRHAAHPGRHRRCRLLDPAAARRPRARGARRGRGRSPASSTST